MEKLMNLSSDKCILLAVYNTTAAKISTLQTLRISRPDVLTVELTLRVLVSYLPENLEPINYVPFIASLLTEARLQQSAEKNEHNGEAVAIDFKAVENLTPNQARKSVKKLHLLPLQQQCLAKEDGAMDLITRFIIQRVHRIEAETGLLDLVPELVIPFIDRSDYLRTWFVSTILPLLRLNYEYYPEITSHQGTDQNNMPTVEVLENLGEEQAVDLLLSRALLGQSGFEDSEQGRNIRRDLRCLVGPWVYGENQRKRRKMRSSRKESSSILRNEITSASIMDESEESSKSIRKSDWIYAFKWLVHLSRINLSAISYLVHNWDGPADVDFGGYLSNTTYLEEEKLGFLKEKYAETALACVFMASSGSEETIAAAHGLLTQVAKLLNYDPIPDLSRSVNRLPRALDKFLSDSTVTTLALQSEVLVNLESPLAVVDQNILSLIVSLVFSAYICSSLNFIRAVRDITAIYFFAKEEDQMAILQQMLQSLVTGRQRNVNEWDDIRGQIIWLWSWDNVRYADGQYYGQGIFGKLSKKIVGTEILKALLTTCCYSVVVKRFIEPSKERRLLSSDDVGVEIIRMLTHLYDNASNGNRTRGNMKKVSDLLAAFQPYYRKTSAFEQYEALVTATHALSFYSLTMQHGVPFQPVNIRVSKDPILLVRKVLEQNTRSYTKLDDLIEIGNNLVAAGLGESQKQHLNQGPESDCNSEQMLEEDIDWQRAVAQRRITVMAIDASLAENDFETAYSYVVNHLRTPLVRIQGAQSKPRVREADINTTEDEPQSDRMYEDDMSWRAAFAAGKYKAKVDGAKATSYSHNNSITATASLSSLTVLRQVNQRMDLLSQALILAPPPSLAEILAVWRRCEEELLAVIAETEDAEGSALSSNNSSAMLAGIPSAFLGSSGGAADQVARTKTKMKPGSQSRSSWNRSDNYGTDEETPVGLLDIARGAAAAFGRTGLLSLPGGSLQSAGGGADTRPTSMASTSSASVSTSRDRAGSAGSAGVNLDDGMHRHNDDFDGGDSYGDEHENDDEATRIRKRDLVANKVTEGLASGIGWVLGAKPVPRQD